jgi:hypothetical protein
MPVPMERATSCRHARGRPARPSRCQRHWCPPPGNGYLIESVTGTGFGLRRVHHAVGAQGDQRVDVVGGHHAAEYLEATQLGGVTTHLVCAVGVHADEFEIGAPNDRAQRMAAHITGGELDDSSHACPLRQVGDGFQARFIQHAGQHAAVDLDRGAVDEICCATA